MIKIKLIAEVDPINGGSLYTIENGQMRSFKIFNDNKDLIKELMNYGLRGIEAYHRKHSPACVEYFSSMAEELGLIVTGGSDFHAPNIINGQVILGKNFVPEWVYEKLLKEKKLIVGLKHH